MHDLAPRKDVDQKPLPSLNTGRCIIRLAQDADVDAVLAYHVENRAHLADGGPAWPSDYLTQDYWLKQIKQNLEDFHDDKAVRFFLFDRANPGVVIGVANLNNIVRGAAQYSNLGYSIAADRQGKSIMKEALQSVTSYGFVALNLHRIMANYQPGNQRSGWLLRSLGFTVEGYARDYLLINGKWCDHILTSMLNPNWAVKE